MNTQIIAIANQKGCYVPVAHVRHRPEREWRSIGKTTTCATLGSLGMVGYRSYDTAVNWNIGSCSCSLVLAVVISAILILCMKEREATQTKKKAKKVAPKKGW